jgi:hypothetical protein
MWVVVLERLVDYGQSHPGHRMWLPLAEAQRLIAQGSVKPDETVRHRDPVSQP